MTKRFWILLGSGLLAVGAGIGWRSSRQLPQPGSPPRAFKHSLDCGHPANSDSEAACTLLRLQGCDQLSIYALDPMDPTGANRPGEGTIGLGSLSLERSVKLPRKPEPAIPLASLFSAAEVLAQTNLQGAQAATLLSSWREQTLGQGTTLCFTPYYGLACWVAGQVLVEWKVCFACEEFYYSFPQTGRVGKNRFDPRTGPARQLRGLLMQALPHPAAALFKSLHKRFEIE